MDVELLKNYPLFEDIQQLKEVLKAPASHLQ